MLAYFTLVSLLFSDLYFYIIWSLGYNTTLPSTVPPSLSSSSSRPEIVLVSSDHIILLE